jgi:hypothetical protein
LRGRNSLSPLDAESGSGFRWAVGEFGFDVGDPFSVEANELSCVSVAEAEVAGAGWNLIGLGVHLFDERLELIELGEHASEAFKDLVIAQEVSS